jgi:hypothetical protein
MTTGYEMDKKNPKTRQIR